MTVAEPVPGQTLAVTAETIYLLNLMLVPGLGFLVLAWLWFKHRQTAPSLAANHLRQTFFVSLWGGLLLVSACAGFILFFGLDSAWTWTYVVIYFTCVHSSLILFGVLGLSKAMAGQTYRDPLIGPRQG
jgi:uncharacterized Tic20 family protein